MKQLEWDQYKGHHEGAVEHILPHNKRRLVGWLFEIMFKNKWGILVSEDEIKAK